LPEHSSRRGHEDEPAVALGLHDAKCGLAQIEAAVQMHAQHPAPVIRRQLVKRDAVEDSRIADYGIEPAESIDRGANDCVCAFGTVDRIVRCHRNAAGGHDPVDNQVGDAGVCTAAVHDPAEVVHYDGGAAAGQLDRVKPAETTAGSGDDHHLPGEVDHLASSLFAARD
jgi:hypothetical protein